MSLVVHEQKKHNFSIHKYIFIVNPIDITYQFDAILGARFRIILISNYKVISPSRSCAVCAKEKQTPTKFISIQLVGVPRTVTTASENPSVIPTRFISNP